MVEGRSRTIAEGVDAQLRTPTGTAHGLSRPLNEVPLVGQPRTWNRPRPSRSGPSRPESFPTADRAGRVGRLSAGDQARELGRKPGPARSRLKAGLRCSQRFHRPTGHGRAEDSRRPGKPVSPATRSAARGLGCGTQGRGLLPPVKSRGLVRIPDLLHGMGRAKRLTRPSRSVMGLACSLRS